LKTNEVSGVPASPIRLRRAGSWTFDEAYWVTENSLKMLWERFLTAINSAGPQPVIVVKTYSPHALTPAEK